MGTTSYLVALGSNRRSRFGSPGDAVRLAAAEIGVKRMSAIRSTRALGPAGREFANAVAMLNTELDPPALLHRLKRIEAGFGRRPGRRWGARVIDLDILLWSGGCWASNGLVIPHRSYRVRDFVLRPLQELAPWWRDPVSGLTVRHLWHRLKRPRAVDP